MYGETLDFQFQHQQWKYKISGRKINFCELTVKTLPCYRANAEIKRLKFLHTLFDKCLDHMLVKFERNRMVQTTRNYELFDKKPGFLKTIFDKALTPILEDVSHVSVTEIIG